MNTYMLYKVDNNYAIYTRNNCLYTCVGSNGKWDNQFLCFIEPYDQKYFVRYIDKDDPIWLKLL